MILRFVLGGLILAGVVNQYLFHSVGSLGVVGFLLILTSIGVIGYGIKRMVSTWYLLVTLGLLGWLTVNRGAIYPQLLMVLGMVISFFVLWYVTLAKKRFVNSFSELLFVPVSLFNTYVVAVLRSIAVVSSQRKRGGSFALRSVSAWVSSIIIGVIIGTPFVVVLLILLRSADPIFNKTLTNVFSYVTFGETSVRITIGLITFLSIIPLAFMRFKQKVLQLSELNVALIKPITVVMTMIAVTLLVFLCVQWPYIFASVAKEYELTNYGISTYSEYVKRGFGEFLVTSFIVYGFLWVGLLALRVYQGKKRPILFYVQTIVIMTFFVFLLSILRRVLLYWEFHGLTVIRFYGSIFLLWVGFLASTVFLRSIKKYSWIYIEAAVGLMFLLGIGIVNIEHVIVTHHPPRVNNTIDIVYLSRLSTDGYEGWKIAYTISKEYLSELHKKNGVLNEEDRRKAAYSGLSLGLLNRQYYRLIYQYGTDADKNEYVKSVLTSFYPEIVETVAVFEESLQTIQHQGDEATVSAGLYISQFGVNKSNTINEHLQQLQTVASHSAMLLNQSNIKTYFYSIQPRSPLSLVNFSSSLCFLSNNNEEQLKTGSLCVPGFIKIAHSFEIPNTVEYLLNWNRRNQYVYSMLKKEIPIENLIMLQEQYVDVWKRISNQSKEDRYYLQDISYDAPLLAPLR